MKEDFKYLNMAIEIASQSIDPNTKVGAIIVSQDSIVLSKGYNSLPKGLKADNYPLDVRTAKNIVDTKYPYMIHAEANAIISAHKDLKNSKLYVTLFPCHECCKLIINAGIKEIIYTDDKYNNDPLVMAGIKMLKDAGVRFRKVQV